MKRMIIILAAVMFTAIACTNSATRIGNPPVLLPDTQQGGGGEGGVDGDTSAKESLVKHASWSGSEMADGELDMYIVIFSDVDVKLWMSGRDAAVTAAYDVSTEGVIGAAFGEGFTVSGSVEEAVGGHLIQLTLYRNGVAVSELFEIAMDGDEPAGLLDPVASCEKTANGCFDSDSNNVMAASQKTLGMVVGGGEDGACSEAFYDHCESSGVLVEYVCDVTGAAVEWKYKCDCVNGRCLAGSQKISENVIKSTKNTYGSGTTAGTTMQEVGDKFFH